MTRITLQYFDGCPNWEQTQRSLAALFDDGWDATVELEQIDTHEKAVEREFSGSPTVLIDGIDPFADNPPAPALACRVYDTPTGPAGTPTIDQLRQAIRKAQTGRSGRAN